MNRQRILVNSPMWVLVAAMVIAASVQCARAAEDAGQETPSSTVNLEDRPPAWMYDIMCVGPLCVDLEIRESRLKCLGRTHGNPADVLRVLWWVAEAEPRLRKELLTQWLCDKNTLPDKEKAKSDLLRLVKTRTAENIAARRAEIDEVFDRIEAEKRVRAAQSPRYSAEGSGSEQLDLLTEEVVFSGNADARRAAFERLPRPKRREGGEPAARAIFVLLWLRESERSTQEILETRIHQTYMDYWYAGCHGKWSRRKDLEHLLADFEEGEQSTRRAALDALDSLQ